MSQHSTNRLVTRSRLTNTSKTAAGSGAMQVRQAFGSKTLPTTHRIAHRPHLAPLGLDARKVQAGEGFMLYWIDAERNHSKFYEGVVLPDEGGTFRVMLRWGALTDSGFTGRIDGAKFDSKFAGLDYSMAKSVLQSKYRAKTGKGYIDAWGPRHKSPDGRPLPKGQYPVGLKREVGFGWGVQDVAFCIPALRQIQDLLLKTQTHLRSKNSSEAADLLGSAMNLAKRDLRAADSTMARKVIENIAHMQGRADYVLEGDFTRISEDKAIRDWTVALSRLSTYIDKQLSLCHGKTARKKIGMNFLQEFSQLTTKFLDLVAQKVGKQLGWKHQQLAPNVPIWVVYDGDQLINIEMDASDVPIMTIWANGIGPLKVKATSADAVSRIVVTKMQRHLRLARRLNSALTYDRSPKMDYMAELHKLNHNYLANLAHIVAGKLGWKADRGGMGIQISNGKQTIFFEVGGGYEIRVFGRSIYGISFEATTVEQGVLTIMRSLDREKDLERA